MDTAIVIVATLVSIGATMYMYAMTNLKSLKADWPMYRCNPAYMPLAGLVGEDPFKNFSECTMKNFQDYTGFVVDPLMAQFSTMTDVVGQIGGAMEDMRKSMSSTRTGFLGIVGMVFGKIQNLMSQFQYIIIRMRTLLARVVGIMMSFMYIFYGAMDTGQSVVNGPIGKTMSFLCFDENTMIKLADGKTTRMNMLRIGDKLPDQNTVMSLYTISGNNVPMYKLGSVIVSGSHKVKYGSSYILVSAHPAAKLYLKGSQGLICLNTLTHRVVIDNIEFLDFFESTESMVKDSAIVRDEIINTDKLGASQTGNVSYPTGLFGHTQVMLANGWTKPIVLVRPGDTLDNGDHVIGIVSHMSTESYYTTVDRGVVAQIGTGIIKNSGVKLAVNVGNIVHDKVPLFLYQLITNKGSYSVISDSDIRYTIVDEMGIRSGV